jgi:hypothetical protein
MPEALRIAGKIGAASQIDRRGNQALGRPARSVMREQHPTVHRGQGQQDCNIHQLPAATSTMPAMPEVVVSGTDFAREVVLPLVDLASTRTPIEPCHDVTLPHNRPTEM